jgi:hypothetical protein
VQKSTAIGTNFNCRKERFAIWLHPGSAHFDNSVEGVVLDALASRHGLSLNFTTGGKSGALVWFSAKRLPSSSEKPIHHFPKRKPLAVQPLHVIAHAVFQGERWFVAQALARIREIGLCKILIMCVRIIDVVRLKTGPQAFV